MRHLCFSWLPASAADIPSMSTGKGDDAADKAPDSE